MKKRLFALAWLGAVSVALGQGRINFNNDLFHLVYFNPDAAQLLPADVTLAGQAVPAGGALPSGVPLLADLYAGPSAGSLALVTSVPFSTAALAGRWMPTTTVLPFPGPGSTVFFQVGIRSVSDNVYLGYSVEFSGVLGTVGTEDLTSFWPAGTFAMDQYGTGAKGAIMVSAVPEPELGALLGLGAAVLLARKAETLKAEKLKH